MNDNVSRLESTGIALQFEGAPTDAQEQELVIGLDFGTAFTKVVVGDNVRERHIAVPFRSGEPDIDRYTLPTVCWQDLAEVYSIDQRSGRQFSDLKLTLIDRGFDEKSYPSVAYLALVFRRVRSHIFEHEKGVYGLNHISWLVNTGLPTENYNDDELKNAYRVMVDLAWVLSASEEDITEDAVDRLFRLDTKDSAEPPPDALEAGCLGLFPEFVAQVTGYVRSPQRQKDLHLMIDVGAGTLDVTTFIVHEDEGEDVFPVFSTCVKPLGTRYLIKHRIGDSHLNEEGELSPFQQVPTDSRFAELLGVTSEKLEDIDQPFRTQAVEAVSQVVRETREKHYPKRFKRPEEKLPVFLCGGGANSDFYRKALHLELGSLNRFPIETRDLPNPEQLEAPGTDDFNYHRLHVACGLSYDPLSIGKITIPDPIDSDILRLESCRKCNGSGGSHFRANCNACGGKGISSTSQD